MIRSTYQAHANRLHAGGDSRPYTRDDALQILVLLAPRIKARARHRVGLARARLAVSQYCGVVTFNKALHEWSDTLPIRFLIGTLREMRPSLCSCAVTQTRTSCELVAPSTASNVNARSLPTTSCFGASSELALRPSMDVGMRMQLLVCSCFSLPLSGRMRTQTSTESESSGRSRRL